MQPDAASLGDRHEARRVTGGEAMQPSRPLSQTQAIGRSQTASNPDSVVVVRAARTRPRSWRGRVHPTRGGVRPPEQPSSRKDPSETTANTGAAFAPNCMPVQRRSWLRGRWAQRFRSDCRYYIPNHHHHQGAAKHPAHFRSHVTLSKLLRLAGLSTLVDDFDVTIAKSRPLLCENDRARGPRSRLKHSSPWGLRTDHVGMMWHAHRQ